MSGRRDRGAPAIGLGLVGAGMIAQIHAAGLAHLERDGEIRVRAVAAFDPSESARAALARNWPIPRFADHAASVIDDPEVDAVMVLTPTAFHRDLVLAVLAAGKPLYCEKPLAPVFPVVRELCDAVAAAERSGSTTAQVGFFSRHHHLMARLKRVIDSGELGAPMGFALRDDQYFPAGDFVSGHSDWRADRAIAGGGALLEHSIHATDLLAWLFGTPASVFARTRHVFGYEVEDVAALTIEHTNGVVGNLVTVFHGGLGREERRLEVFFERGVVEVGTDFLVGAPEESWRIQRRGKPPEDVPPVEILAEHLDALGVRGGSFAFFQYLTDRDWLRAIASGVPASPGFADALVAHGIVEAAYRSAASGAPVALDDVLAS